ncbi:MAG: hypothetical protein WC876_01980 [Candidatus Thermoplasmatota archaeon]|jgi:hypothetical protein
METENDEPKVIRTEPMGALLRIDVQDQSERSLKLFEERVRSAKEQLKIALRLVQPGQFIVMASENGSESVYATGAAADRILRMGFGMRWGEKVVTLSRDDKGTQWAVCRAPLLKQDGETYEVFEGRRKLGGFVKTEADLIKGSIENLKHQAVTDLLGLRFLTSADLKDLGLDTSKLPRRAEFQEHGADETGVAVVPWGKMKGKPITDIEDKDIAYYEGKARESIADPAKSKFADREKRWLLSLEAEKKRRTAPADAKPDTKPASAYQRILAILKAGGTEGAAANAYIKRVTGKAKGSECDEDSVAQIQAAVAADAADVP